MNRLNKRDFGRKYQNFNDWTLETAFMMYEDMLDGLYEDLEKEKKRVDNKFYNLSKKK